MMVDVEDEKFTLRIEALEVAKEVAYAVDYVEIAKDLPNGDKVIHLNLRTQEEQEFSVELTDQGFRVVGNKFNMVDENASSQYFETIYALLDNHSPKYRKSFGDALLRKLENLQMSQKESDHNENTVRNEDPSHCS
ncbi:GSK3-beta interaction protein-like [Mizuhopecten yessoensis]|uniref:GSK3-beta interaction protein-like n=1 Tax=Mizuhopecten yessoensis TaxID=6573 RepID=UPI000B4586F1|nr:GSK3-beta interaction protein-like [Mizuhopecten yessoensis]